MLKNKQKRFLFDIGLASLICISSLITVGFLLWIVWYVISNGLEHVTWEFIFGDYSVLGESKGIWPMIVSTLYIVILSIAIAAPIGMMTAIYLTEYAKPGNKFVKVINFCTASLAGIPSIVFGLFGLTFFGVVLGLGYSILSGALTLSIMILPVIIRATEEALIAVPNTYREGSLALGSSKINTIRRLIVPSAMPGILTSVILSVGTVVSESAPLFLTAGFATQVPDSMFDSGRTLTVHLYKLTSELFDVSEWNQAYATATVLLIIVLGLNFLTKLIARKFNKATY